MPFNTIPKSVGSFDGYQMKGVEGAKALYTWLKNNYSIEDPITINLETHEIKLNRALASLNRKELKKIFNLAYTPKLGNGQRNGENAGIAHEKSVVSELNIFESERDLSYNYKNQEIIKYVNENFSWDGKVDIIHSGGNNNKRPLTFVDNSWEDNIFVGGQATHIGQTVADVILKNGKDAYMYLSLKYGKSTNIFNCGTAWFILAEEIRNGKITNPYALKLFDMLGLEADRFVNVYHIYEEGRPADKNKVYNDILMNQFFRSERLHKFLASAFGYGYELIKTHENGKVSILPLDTLEKTYKLTEPLSIKTYYPIGQSKTVNVVIDTVGFDISLNFRNTNGGLYPTMLTGRYNVK